MGCDNTVTLYDADKVDALQGKLGRFTATVPQTAATPKRLYIVVMPCLCGDQGGCSDERDDDGVTFPDDVSSDQEADCEIWSEEFYNGR